MVVFIPVSYEDRDYRPSWTGNSYYPTATIRGIFDSKDKAEKAISGWDCEDDCSIIERWFEDENGNEIDYQSFDIDYDGYLHVRGSEDGDYILNEVIDEPYSAVYDEFRQLGVTDY